MINILIDQMNYRDQMRFEIDCYNAAIAKGVDAGDQTPKVCTGCDKPFMPYENDDEVCEVCED